MEENKVFTYHYSARRNKEIESIRKKYIGKEESKIDRLRKMDRKVRLAGRVPGLLIGTVGALVFGIGMCFGLEVLAGEDVFTALFCAAGIIIMTLSYPIYRYIEKETRSTLAPKILRLADEIILNER